MSRALHVFNLRMLREQYESEHVDEIVETIDVALWAIETQEQLKKERDAAIAMAQPEIIRCKDCKHSHGDKLFTMLWCHGDIVDKNHFCSRAERETDENND